MNDAFSMGVKDAENAIAAGESGGADCKDTLDHLIHYHALKKKGDQRMLKYSYGTFIEARKNGEFDDYKIEDDPFFKKYTILTQKWKVIA